MSLAPQIFEALEVEIYARLTQGHCEACGRTGASTAELDLVRRWLNDHGYIRPSKEDPVETNLRALPHGHYDPEAPHKASAGGL